MSLFKGGCNGFESELHVAVVNVGGPLHVSIDMLHFRGLIELRKRVIYIV